MKLEGTQMAAEIHAAGIDMATDLACKRVLALKVILAPILQRVVKEYHNYTPEEIAERFIDSAEIEIPVHKTLAGTSSAGLKENATFTFTLKGKRPWNSLALEPS